MFYYLAQMFQGNVHALRELQYITFRSIMAALTAFLVCILCGPAIIRAIKQMQLGQMVRDDGPRSHLSKMGTPTMGGLLILLGVTFACFLWCDLQQPNLWVALLVTLAFGWVGWLDDYRKIAKKKSTGLFARQKFALQSLIAVAAILAIYWIGTPNLQKITIPFLKNIFLDLGWFFPIFIYLVIVGSSNAVNLTDGLDGLAILPIVMVIGALGVFTYIASHIGFAKYLSVPYIADAGELTVFCSAVVGAGLGFLWYNAYPAEIFMGDVGSLSLGAALGTVAVLIRQELVLVIMGGVFVIETLSVILQVVYFRYTGGKRLFKMAPIHHHFELIGWSEPKVIVRFWIMTCVLVLVGLATLKLR
jgi:phospho-N-acetylmuramoyl-pentapeptide-transferase